MIKADGERLLFAVDLAGTLFFAIEGGSAATYGGLDLLGVLVLALATALGGGIIRDLLIGAVPPASLRDWRYAALAFLGGFLFFFLHRYASGISPWFVLILDAAGLSLFAIAGTEKALLYKMPAFVAILLGTITAVGGGVLRDIFLSRVPALASGNLRNGSNRRFGCHDPWRKTGTVAPLGRHFRRPYLLYVAASQSLVPLEPSAPELLALLLMTMLEAEDKSCNPKRR